MGGMQGGWKSYLFLNLEKRGSVILEGEKMLEDFLFGRGEA